MYEETGTEKLVLIMDIFFNLNLESCQCYHIKALTKAAVKSTVSWQKSADVGKLYALADNKIIHNIRYASRM